MNDRSSPPIQDRFQAKPTAESHFAWLRTRLSIERTMMAWVRTATALIGFGFTIVQFFERFSDMKGVLTAERPMAPRYLGLAMIFCGVAALLISIWQYRKVLSYLWSRDFVPVAGIDPEGGQTPLLAVSIALVFVGAFAFFSIMVRWV